jgi:sigma-B regulation protein RsbU (phosphoserine phosphatase)
MLVASVAPGTAAERAGLRPGDQVLAVNGQRLDSLEPFYSAVGRGKPGEVVTLSVEHPGAVTPLTLRVTLQPWPATRTMSLAETLTFEMVAAFPVWFVLVSFPVLFLRLEDRNAWLLALLFSGLIAGAPLFPFEFIIPSAIRGFALAYKIIFFELFPALFNYFFAVFPASSALDRRVPWFKTVSLAGAAVIALPPGLWTLFAGNASVALRLDTWSWRHAPVHWLVMVYSFGLIPAGVASLISNGFFSPSVDVRRKIRVIVWGTIAGFLPGLALQTATMVTGKQVPEIFPLWIWAPLVFGSFWLFPLSFAYAVVKHRVLEIPVLLKRSARFLVVQWGVHILGILLTVIFALLLGRVFSRMISGHPEISVIPAIALGGLILWLGIVVGGRVNKRIDRAFFRSSYDARQILEDLAEKTRTSTGREQLASLLENHIQEALHPASLAVYLEVSDGRLQGVRGNNPSGSIELSAKLPLLVELAKRGQPWEVPPNFEEKSISTLMTPKAECLVPILGSREGQLQGLLVLGPRLSEETYSREDKRLLASVASQTAGALRSISLAERIAEQLEIERRVARDMEIAKQVQARLFPQKLPSLHTLEYAGRCIQARHVGGDYYDFLSLGAGRIGIVLADIAGKGIPGALLMANLQAGMRSQCATASQDLPQFLKSVNHAFYESTDEGSYATLFFGDYQDSTRRLRFANCGHNPPFLVRSQGTAERLTATATVLGLFEEWESSICDVQVAPGDILVIYTDGITEANNSAGEEFGESRLLETIRANLALSVPLILDAVLTAALEFSQSEQGDDLTLVVARGR